MKLVIAEKPSVGVSIAKVLNANDRQNGYYEGSGYIVTWCVGHLIALSDPNYYGDYKVWKIEDLPIIPCTWNTEVSTNTKSQFNIVKSLMLRKDVDEIVCATDAGREGELIFRLVYDKVNPKKPYKRLCISSMEDTAIENGFHNLKEGKDYENLYRSAIARAKADWLVGFNLTRYYTCLYNNSGLLLNVGRVQTPTLALIVDRDEKIENFKVEDFYYLQGALGDLKIKSERYENKNNCDEDLSRIIESNTICTKSDTKDIAVKSPLPYDLTTLQREANRKIGFTAEKALNVLQNLYEKKLVTYPRTDSKYLTKDMRGTAIKIAEAYGLKDISPDKIIDDKKVSDHHAVIPTLSSVKLIKSLNLTKDEIKIFKLVKYRFLKSVSPNGIDVKTELEFENSNILFKANVKFIKSEGFRTVGKNYEDKPNEEDNYISSFDNRFIVGNQYDFNYSVETGKTTPPKYYTEDTLLSSMEKAGNEDLDKDLDTEKSGIGTPATRSGIIEKLISSGYVKRVKKDLKSTDIGRELIKMVPESLKSAKTTADWENKLTLISMGELDEDTFISDIIDATIKVISEKPSYNPNFTSNKTVLGKCPRCGGNIYLNNKFYVCDKNCGFKIYKDNLFFKNKGKKLTDSMIKEILEKGETYVQAFTSKNGIKYNAYVKIVDAGKYINFEMEFENNR